MTENVWYGMNIRFCLQKWTASSYIFRHFLLFVRFSNLLVYEEVAHQIQSERIKFFVQTISHHIGNGKRKIIAPNTDAVKIQNICDKN